MACGNATTRSKDAGAPDALAAVSVASRFHSNTPAAGTLTTGADVPAIAEARDGPASVAADPATTGSRGRSTGTVTASTIPASADVDAGICGVGGETSEGTWAANDSERLGAMTTADVEAGPISDVTSGSLASASGTMTVAVN